MPHYSELCKGCEGVSLGDLLAHVLQAATVVSLKNSEERTDTGDMPAGNKTGDQIKICVPSLLKEKWRSEIQ